jgi:hypothetical protein
MIHMSGDIQQTWYRLHFDWKQHMHVTLLCTGCETGFQLLRLACAAFPVNIILAAAVAAVQMHDSFEPGLWPAP